MQRLIEQRQRNILYFILMLIMLVLFLVELLGLGSLATSGKGRTNLPVSIRAGSQADYAQNAGTRIPPINPYIFQQIMQDIPGTGSPEERVSTLQASLSTPVLTMTLNPKMPTSAIPSSALNGFGSTTPQATASIQVTSASVTPMPTSISTYSSTPTVPTSSTPAPPATKKPRPTSKPRPTRKP